MYSYSYSSTRIYRTSIQCEYSCTRTRTRTYINIVTLLCARAVRSAKYTKIQSYTRKSISMVSAMLGMLS